MLCLGSEAALTLVFPESNRIQNPCKSGVSDPDPGSSAFLTPISVIRDGKKKFGPGMNMNIPDHFSESLETVFGLKMLTFFDENPDPGSF